MPTSFLPRPVLPHAADENRRMRVVVAFAAMLTTAFVVGHVPFIPGTLDDVDSTNFVLAVDRYDPGAHQPHPPGFPVHVALGRVVNSVFQTFSPTGAESDLGSVAASLRMWSVICGALAVFSLMWIATGLGATPSRSALVAALTATCPLFWVTAMRPLSDLPGLCFSMLSQGLALAAYNEMAPRAVETTGPADKRSRIRLEYRLLGAAVIAGLAVGVRVQTALLTMPLLALVTLLFARHRGPAIIAQVSLAVMGGVLAWAVPLIGVVGGPAEYLRLMTTAAAHDVQGVEMLATHPGPRLLALALFRTFIVPWGSDVLGWSAFGLAALGAFRLARHNRQALGFVAAMAMPYLAFHLLFQETVSIRYSLPLVPISCLLIIANFRRRPTRSAIALTAALLAFAGTLSVSAATAYGRIESPVARALEDLKNESPDQRQPSTMAFHHSVAQAIRGEAWPGRVLNAPVSYEWLELARYWLNGGRDAVAFLGDPRRTDLALIDPASRTLVRAYRWPAHTESLLGGIQPLGVNRYEIVPPGWFLMRGWALTPEAHGVASRDGQAPGTTGIVAYLRRRDAAAVMMIGGRNLGGACDIGASVEVSVDGWPRATWVAASRSPFLQVIRFAPGELHGDGDYAMVRVTARDAASTARIVDVAIEHFDVQSPGSALAGFDRGWHMPELVPSSGLSWRWTDEAAELRVEGFGRDVELVVRGESPLRYFASPPRVVVRAGQTELAAFHPDADFAWVIRVPAAALAASGGRVTFESDKWFIPDEVTGNGDRRRLALRIYSVEARLGPRSAEPLP